MFPITILQKHICLTKELGSAGIARHYYTMLKLNHHIRWLIDSENYVRFLSLISTRDRFFMVSLPSFTLLIIKQMNKCEKSSGLCPGIGSVLTLYAVSWQAHNNFCAHVFCAPDTPTAVFLPGLLSTPYLYEICTWMFPTHLKH